MDIISVLYIVSILVFLFAYIRDRRDEAKFKEALRDHGHQLLASEIEKHMRVRFRLVAAATTFMIICLLARLAEWFLL